MKRFFVTLLWVVCVSSGSFASPKQLKKAHQVKPSAVQMPATTTKAQVAILKQQVHVYTVWVRRTLDDCKRDDENDARFNEQKTEALQDNAEYHLKAMDDMLEKKKAIGRDIADDLKKSIAAYKVMQSNPLFPKLYLEMERCYPDNFVPQGFQADQLAKMRFVELK